jgi:flavin-dependent dehydrogenase
MGVWDKVERAGFPVKIGATYRWGTTPELWDFEFIANGELTETARPGKYQGERTKTAFQVDRAIYDKILLDHARELGAKVREETAVREVLVEGDEVTGVVLSTGETVVARHYVDCSGHSGILRRTMGVEAQYPSSLQNIAIWDYWQNAEWAVKIGIGGTRVQVMSLGYGWIWFIPLGPTRTSIGLIVPAEYYKQSGKRPSELYEEAIRTEPLISQLIQNATCEGKLATTKDWSFLSERLAGKNWFLAGESAGFADPILAAGMTLAHASARDAAYSIIAIDERAYEPEWTREYYDQSNRRRIGQHIRFADFWYTVNGQFTDLVDFTSKIAADAGLDLEPKKAWQWLGTGGFIDHAEGIAGIGAYNLVSVKHFAEKFANMGDSWQISGKNIFRLNLQDAEKEWAAVMEDGRIRRFRQFRRVGKLLPAEGIYQVLIGILKKGESYDHVREGLMAHGRNHGMTLQEFREMQGQALEALEAMALDGWLELDYDPAGGEPLKLDQPSVEKWLHKNRDVAQRSTITA